MSMHLLREMEAMKRSALDMCVHVEQIVVDATLAFLERDPEYTRKVIAADRTIDAMELELSENCLKTLALYQPVAGDLRFIFSLAKIAGILERVGDLAENLARKGKSLSRLGVVPTPPELSEMAEATREMLRLAMDSMVENNAEKAKGVLAADHEVNARKRLVRKAAEEAIVAAPDSCAQWLIIVAASRNIERMADMAANIAAEVVYSVDGKVIRHGFDCE